MIDPAIEAVARTVREVSRQPPNPFDGYVAVAVLAAARAHGWTPPKAHHHGPRP